MPKRGCGARARAPTPSGTSSTPSRTPGTSWTPCTRSRSMVSWWPWGHGDVVVWLGLRLPACSGVLWLACKWLLGPACPQTCTHGAARCCDALLGFVRARRSQCGDTWPWGGRGAALALQLLLSPSVASTNLCSRPAAIIEHVRDGSVVRALLLPDYYLVTVMLSGIKVRFGCCCPLPAYRARCHLGALGTSEGPHPHPLLPRPSGVPWHRAWHSPWGARTVVGPSLRDGDTWGQQAPAWWGMPWEGPRQLGEGWPHPTRRAQPLCGCVVGGFGGSWGHPCAPWCWGLLLRALWARPLLQHQ